MGVWLPLLSSELSVPGGLLRAAPYVNEMNKSEAQREKKMWGRFRWCSLFPYLSAITVKRERTTIKMCASHTHTKVQGDFPCWQASWTHHNLLKRVTNSENRSVCIWKMQVLCSARCDVESSFVCRYSALENKTSLPKWILFSLSAFSENEQTSHFFLQSV